MPPVKPTPSAAKRYLELLRRSLLDEIYVENEVRLLYIFLMMQSGRPIDEAALRNPAAHYPELVAGIRGAREEGRPWWQMQLRMADGSARVVSFRNVCEFSHSMMGRRRMENLEHCLDRIREDKVPGDLMETGVWRGGGTVFMRGYLEAHGMPDRLVWAADSFEGLPAPSQPQDAGRDFSAARMPILAVSLDEVQEVFRRYDLLDDRVRFLKGWFRDTLPAAPVDRLAVLRLDGDLYESTRDALVPLYDKLSSGGFVIVDDYGDFGPCRQAVDEFRSARGIASPLEPVDWSCVFWRKE
jgi:hypothetical protein